MNKETLIEKVKKAEENHQKRKAAETPIEDHQYISKFNWAMPFKPRLNMFKSSTGHFKFDLNTGKTYSYEWYLLGSFANVNGKLTYVLNSYRYSSTTNKHIWCLRSLLSDLNIDYIELDAPNGLDNKEVAIEHYTKKIETLQEAINAPRSHKSKNRERQELIEEYKSNIIQLESMELVTL